MRYKIPENVLECSIYRAGFVTIHAEDGESMVEIVCAIARHSIAKGVAVGLGVLAEIEATRAQRPLISEEEDGWLMEWVASGMINIDYWRGRSIKLLLNERGDHWELSLTSWVDRWNIQGGLMPSFVVDELREVLEAAKNEIASNRTAHT